MVLNNGDGDDACSLLYRPRYETTFAEFRQV